MPRPGRPGGPPPRPGPNGAAPLDRTLALVRAIGEVEATFAVHGMRLPLGALLVARAFELWTHDNDIRHATGLPSSVPDASTLRRMTELAARLLPHAAARAGLHEAVNVRLVLTGPGGGTWDVAVGGGPPEPVPVRVVTSAVGFCPLVANRLTLPKSTRMSRAILTGPSGYWSRRRSSHSTKKRSQSGDPRQLSVTYPCRMLRAARRAGTQGEDPGHERANHREVPGRHCQVPPGPD